MKRRKLLVLVGVAGGTALLLVLFVAPTRIRNYLAARALEEVITEKTGLPCSVGNVSVHHRTVRDLVVGEPQSPFLEIDVLHLHGRDFRNPSGFTASGAIKINVPELPPLEFRKVEVSASNFGAPGDESPAERGQVIAKGNLTDLNPLLAEHGKVRAERGRFVIVATVKLDKEAELDCSIDVTFLDFLVRSLDGKFEFEAKEVTASIKVTGPPKSPRFDLGELEPYLGEKFVESFGKYKP